MTIKDNFDRSEYSYNRFPTRVVHIGNIALGGNNPIRVQSMVNTSPEDIEGTIRQIIQLSEAGCEIVRLTVPSITDAHNLGKIKEALISMGISTPLVADVHFNPSIAEISAQHVEKVRINPGNYRKPGSRTPDLWDAAANRAALDEIEELLAKLIAVCRSRKTAIRIGSNHGSLSPRIMEYYGDTPFGMVEAALEFARIFNKHNFHDLVISMKSSNVRVMVQAYRLLVSRMVEEGFNYPVHLGVTEAGLGNEGRIKSAAGIGLLLDEGIGDTIRISLTEDPVEEIPVAKRLIERYQNFTEVAHIGYTQALPYDPFSYSRRGSLAVAGIGDSTPPSVIGNSNSIDQSPDYFVEPGDLPPLFQQLRKSDTIISLINNTIQTTQAVSSGNAVAILLPETPDEDLISKISGTKNLILILQTLIHNHTGNLKLWMALIHRHKIDLPVVLKIESGKAEWEKVVLNTACIASALLVDGMADGLWITGDTAQEGLNQLSYQILQATRARITSTEYISCPSCGRTKFNIQAAAEQIKARTAHLTGLKIGIMGCIVNGPGEMADADYGYVGAGNRTITLYKGKVVMQKGVIEDEAIDALIDLIKKGGDWIEP